VYNPAGNFMGQLKENVMKRPGNPESFSEDDSD
jgi:hypothetical protein